MDIELKRLRQVVAVARTGSFSAAADELHITQPALSRSISIIEERYGIRIFERGRSGATLTSAGKQVLSEAETLLQGAQAVDHNLRMLSQGLAGRVAVGMGPLIVSLVMPAVGLKCLQERPDLEVHVVARPATLLYEELKEGHIELLFCSARQLADKTDIEQEAVGEVAIAALVRSGHRLAATRKVTPAQLAELPLLTGAEVQSSAGERHTGGLVCDNYEVLRQMTLASDAIWLSSPNLAKEEIADGRLVALRRVKTSIPDRVPVFMVTRRGERLSPAGAAIRDYVREHLAEA